MSDTEDQSAEQPIEPDEPSQDRRRLIALVVGTLVLVGGVLWWANSRQHSSFGSSQTIHVTYKIDGSASSADITMQTPSGSSQQNGVDVPLRRRNAAVSTSTSIDASGGIHGSTTAEEGLSFDFPTGHFLYIAAQNKGSGTITCHILIEGVEVAANTAQGQYAIATCSA